MLAHIADFEPHATAIESREQELAVSLRRVSILRPAWLRRPQDAQLIPDMRKARSNPGLSPITLWRGLRRRSVGH